MSRRGFMTADFSALILPPILKIFEQALGGSVARGNGRRRLPATT